jgi:holo-[acyl-carrier protein] synthase
MDIQNLSQMQKAMKEHGQKFLDRVFTTEEQALCTAGRASLQRFAGRFCAKEAFLKALGTGWTQGIRWTEVECLRNENGAPVLVLHARAKELAEQRGVARIWVSISHTAELAAAKVVLES